MALRGGPTIDVESVTGMTQNQLLEQWFDNLPGIAVFDRDISAYYDILQGFKDWYRTNASELPTLTGPYLCWLLMMYFKVPADKTKSFMQTDAWMTQSQKYISRCNEARAVAFSSPRHAGVVRRANGETPLETQMAQARVEWRMYMEGEKKKKIEKEERERRAKLEAERAKQQAEDTDPEDDESLLRTPPQNPGGNNQNYAAFGPWSPNVQLGDDQDENTIPASQTQLDNPQAIPQNYNQDDSQELRDLFLNDDDGEWTSQAEGLSADMAVLIGKLDLASEGASLGADGYTLE